MAWRVAVIGAGGIGGYFASLACDVGAEVVLCVRTPIERLLVERDGETREVGVAIATEPSQVERADHVIVAVKGQDAAGVGPWLAALAGPATVVAIAQNGVEHRERIGPLAPGCALIPMLVYITVEPVAPGHVRHSTGNRVVIPADAVSERFAALLEPSGVEFERDPGFLTAAWRKLLGNVVANPLTALTLRRSEVLRDEHVDELSVALLGEAIAVGRAEGAGFEPGELDSIHAMLRAVPGRNGTSMLFDRLAQRPLEHELITGAVVRGGAKHGIPTPANDVLLSLLRAVDGGIRQGAST
jgi:2-dehydropantoate 2-reductase